MSQTMQTPVHELAVAPPLVESPRNAERQIGDWLTRYLATLFDVPPDKIDRDMTFQEHGLDSATAVGMSGELGDWLGCDVIPSIAYHYPSINDLAKALASDSAVRASFGTGKAEA